KIHRFCKHEARASYSAAHRLCAERFDCRGVALQQPQNASINLREQPHPNIEYVGGDLEAVIETAENERVRWQTQFISRETTIRDPARCVVDLITVWEVGNFLAVKLGLFGPNQSLIGNNIVDIICSHRTRISQIIDLDGRGPMRKNPGP